jgi:hypothetical protein
MLRTLQAAAHGAGIGIGIRIRIRIRIPSWIESFSGETIFLENRSLDGRFSGDLTGFREPGQLCAEGLNKSGGVGVQRPGWFSSTRSMAISRRGAAESCPSSRLAAGFTHACA